MTDRTRVVAGSPEAAREREAGGHLAELSEDGTLVERIRAGDRQAFAVLVRRYQGSLTRVAMSYVSTRQSAEELAQEAWIGVMEGLARFEARSSFRTWLFAILINRAKTRGVREGRSVPFSALREEDGRPQEGALPASRFDAKGRWAEPPSDWHEETPEALLQKAEIRAALSEAIVTLADNYRLVLTLRDIEGLDAEDVCRLLEISEANQRVLLHRARSKVRQAIEARLVGK